MQTHRKFSMRTRLLNGSLEYQVTQDKKESGLGSKKMQKKSIPVVAGLISICLGQVQRMIFLAKR
jgi:hypothetical protein